MGLRRSRPRKSNCAAALRPIRFHRDCGSGKSSKRAEVLLRMISCLPASGAGLLRNWFRGTLGRASLRTGARYPPARAGHSPAVRPPPGGQSPGRGAAAPRGRGRFRAQPRFTPYRGGASPEVRSSAGGQLTRNGDRVSRRLEQVHAHARQFTRNRDDASRGLVQVGAQPRFTPRRGGASPEVRLRTGAQFAREGHGVSRLLVQVHGEPRFTR